MQLSQFTQLTWLIEAHTTFLKLKQHVEAYPRPQTPFFHTICKLPWTSSPHIPRLELSCFLFSSVRLLEQTCIWQTLSSLRLCMCAQRHSCNCCLGRYIGFLYNVQPEWHSPFLFSYIWASYHHSTETLEQLVIQCIFIPFEFLIMFDKSLKYF